MTPSLDEVRVIASVAGGRVEEMERVGRLPADLAASFAAAGLFRQLVPTSAVSRGTGAPALLVVPVKSLARLTPPLPRSSKRMM